MPTRLHTEPSSCQANSTSPLSPACNYVDLSCMKVRDAIQELAGLSALGIAPDTLAATALVQACAGRDMVLAQSIFDELFSK